MRARDYEILRIGALGAAIILPKAIIEPIREIGDIVFQGIAASTRERAESVAGSAGSRIKIFDNYEALIQSDEVDAVYIPLANHLHEEWIIRAAKSKKHILVEKPLCIKSSQFKQIKAVVEENAVNLTEALMVRHHPWQQKLKEIIDANQYGKLVSIQTNIFCELKHDENNYRFHKKMGGGVFYDSASYWIQFVQSIIHEQPLGIEGKSDFSGPNSIDDEFQAQMIFPGSMVANFHCSYNRPFEASHRIQFEEALIHIGNFFRPIFGKAKLIMDIIHKGEKERIVFPPQNYYINQLKFFASVIRGEIKNIPLSEYEVRVNLMESIYTTASKCKQTAF